MAIMNLDSEERIKALAAIARGITALPLADQYRIMASEGATTEDFHWKVLYDPDHLGLQKSVTVIPVVKPSGK